ncbi:MAG: hypothetical protein JW918_00950 [Anaerolineae bacterium]|nr:hypothetical protein [Anaerolineae bacterium]
MAKRRMINKVRTDTLEGKIAHYKALGNYDAAFAIEALARQIGAPIDAAAIDAQTKMRAALYLDDEGNVTKGEEDAHN